MRVEQSRSHENFTTLEGIKRQDCSSLEASNEIYRGT